MLFEIKLSTFLNMVNIILWIGDSLKRKYFITLIFYNSNNIYLSHNQEKRHTDIII